MECNFCGNPESVLLYKDNSHLVKCTKCGLVYSMVRMNIDSMKKFYNEEYFISTDSVKRGYAHYFNDKKNIVKTFQKRLNLIKQYSPEKGRLLDIGCAAGFFLHIARKAGWDVEGVDISSVCAEYAKNNLNLKVYNDIFTNLELKDEPFDLITMWDYLEHSLSPRDDIFHARKLLKPGGLLVIATPDISSVPSRIFKSHWIGIKLEEHFYYFSRKTLINFLANSGFDVLKDCYIGKYVSSAIFGERLMYYNKFLFRTTKKLFEKMRFSFYCNPFDIMCLILKKKKYEK